MDGAGSAATRTPDRPAPPNGATGSVLVVEDESLVALVVADALEHAGWRLCGTAATEADALRLAAESPPDYAVVDIRLGPGNDGLRVGRALTRRGVTVLYASAYGPGYRQEMEDSGGRACLQKPFAAEDVPLALRALRGLKRGEKPPRLPPALHLFVD
jgi:DNA-binding response OmpR family regulator